jgi:peptide deformylase
MSDVLTIDTGAGTIKEEKIEPLTVYADTHPLLSVELPEYTEQLPNKEMYTLIKRLKMTMKLYGGVGLSANQCGLKDRVFVIGTDQFQIACINPKVLEVSEEKIKDLEGCLSFPAMFMKVERPKSVYAEYTDENGEVHQEWFSGLTARCFLHETDHMNGVKFTKYVGPLAIKMAKQKQVKRIKTVKRKMKNVI